MNLVEMHPSTLAKLDEIKQQLNQEKDLSAHIKSDMYTHLGEVLNRITKYHPYDGFDRFEEISTLVKETKTKRADSKKDSDLNGKTAPPSITTKEALAYIEKAKTLLNEMPDSSIKSDDKKLFTTNTKFVIPNLSEQAKMLEWAGINFGDDTVHLMQKSLKRLASMSGASSLKFFGKIYGTQKDYWIVQGILPFQEEKPYPDQEVRGTGVNLYTYWVSDSVFADWIQLPDAQAEHIVIAKMVKR